MKIKQKLQQIWASPDNRIILLALLIYLPFIFLGYGSDFDSYNVLWAGRNYVETLDYVPSRVPGFVVYEALVLALDTLGGSVLTNLLSLFMSLAILWVFMRVCRMHEIPHYHLLTLILMVHPFFWVNSTCTMDYLIAMGFAFIGFYQLLKGRYTAAGILMALGIGSRLTTLIYVGIILLWFFITRPGERQGAVRTGLITIFLGLLFYVPPADFSEWDTRFLQPSVATQEYWTLPLRVGRFVYKNLFYFWNPLAFAILIWGAARLLRNFKQEQKKARFSLLIAGAVVILGVELFYFRLPTEPAYLLPTVPFWLMLLGAAFENKRGVLMVLLAAMLAFNFVSVNIARPDEKNYATGADYGLWVEPGHLVNDSRVRLEYLACGNQPCIDLEKAGQEEFE